MEKLYIFIRLAPIYSSDEDDSDLDSRKVRKTDRARAALKDSDEESDASD